MRNLKGVLFLNALSCLGFGTYFFTTPTETSVFLAQTEEYATLLSWIGAGLFLNGLNLLWSIYKGPRYKDVLFFVLGDFLWVIATIVLIALKMLIITSDGVLASIVISLMVGAFGALQFRSLKALKN